MFKKLNFKNILLIILLISNIFFLITIFSQSSNRSFSSFLFSLKQTIKPIAIPAMEYLGLRQKLTFDEVTIYWHQTLKENHHKDLFFKIEMAPINNLSNEEKSKLAVNTSSATIDTLFLEGNENKIIHSFDGKKSAKIFTITENIKNNPLPALALISSEIVHGDADDGRTFDDLIDTIAKRNLRLSCGAMSSLAKEFLEKKGLKSRIISTLSLAEWNSYDNGHTLLEVFVPKFKKWVLVDLDLKKLFYIKSTNELASAKDFFLLPFDDILLIDLVNSTKLDYSREKYNVTNEVLFYMTEEWFKNKFQAVGIRDPNSRNVYYPVKSMDDKRSLRINEYPDNFFKTVEFEKFIELFYAI